MKKLTTAQRALDILKSIPSKEFITLNYVDEKAQKCCARGHIIRIECNKGKYSEEEIGDKGGLLSCPLDEAIVHSSFDFLKKKKIYGSIATVNNNPTGKYKQKTPKGRVISLLEDMVEAGY